MDRCLTLGISLGQCGWHQRVILFRSNKIPLPIVLSPLSYCEVSPSVENRKTPVEEEEEEGEEDLESPN